MLNTQRGSALLLAIVMFAVLFGLLGIILEQSFQLSTQVQEAQRQDVAMNLAEAGVEYALHRLHSVGDDFSDEETLELDIGSVLIAMSPSKISGHIDITATGIPRGTTGMQSQQFILRVTVSRAPDGNFFLHSREEARA